MAKKELLICALLVTCSIVFLGFNLGSLSSLKGDENYYFQGARRMIRDADFITPRYHHHIRFEKPPFYYWVVAGSFKILGVSWSSARLASVLSGTLTILIIYLLALELFGRKAALFSILALATNEMFFRYSRLCVSDITFLFLISLSLFLFMKGYKTKARVYFLVSFIPMGLAALTKGPVGPILVILIIVTFLIKERRYRDPAPAVKTLLTLFLGILILLAVVLPWVIAMASIHKEAFLGHIWSVEMVSKVLPKAVTGESVISRVWHLARSFGYYVPVVLFSFLPWSLFLPFALFRKPRPLQGRGKKAPVTREGNHFFLCWFWVVFIFFSLVGFKHTHYMLALSPALAVIVGTFVAKLPKKIPTTIGVASLALFLSLAGFILPYLDDGAMRVFSLKVANQIEKDDRIGMASRQFNIKKLGMHMNNMVFSPYEQSGDDLAQYVYVDKNNNLVPSLKSNERIFVLITKADYLEFVPVQLRRELFILEKHMVWKRTRFDKELVESILSGNLEQLKEEVYLISNGR